MGAGQKKRMLASILLITTLSLLVVGCKAARVPAQITSATAPSAQSEPTISEIRSTGEDVNFEICGEAEAENWPYPQFTLGAIPAACTPTAPSEPQNSRLRITNNGVVDVKGLTIIFPEDRIEFGDIPAGETSEYRDVPHGVFRYAAYRLQVSGNTIEQPVIDWVGERPMDGLAFTYAIEVDPDRNN